MAAPIIWQWCYFIIGKYKRNICVWRGAGKVDPYVVIQFKNQEQKSTTGHRKKTSKSRLRCCLCLRGQIVSIKYE